MHTNNIARNEVTAAHSSPHPKLAPPVPPRPVLADLFIFVSFCLGKEEESVDAAAENPSVAADSSAAVSSTSDDDSKQNTTHSASAATVSTAAPVAANAPSAGESESVSDQAVTAIDVVVEGTEQHCNY